MSKPELVQQFNNTLMKKLESTLTENSALGKWAKLRSTIYSTALDTFGKKSSKTYNWLDSKAAVKMPVVEDKQSAHLQYICQNQKIYKHIKMQERKFSKQP